jgi:parallel beta-helix repeat protein
MKRFILIFILLGLINRGFSAGSYRTDGLASPRPISPKYKTNITAPIPSNDWWTSFLIDRLSYLAMAFPLGYEVKNLNDNQWGLAMQYKGIGFLSGAGNSDVSTSDDPDIWVKANNIVRGNMTAKVCHYGDWSVSVVLSDDNTFKIKAALVKGSPFSYYEFSSPSSPEMYFNFAVSRFFDDSNNTLLTYDGARYTNDHIGIQFVSGKYFAIFCPPNTVFTRVNGNYLQISLGSGQNYMSVAVITSTSDLNYYYQHSYAFITNTRVSYSYDPTSQKVTTTFSALVNLKRGGFSSNPILGLFPHQWKYSSASKGSQYYDTQRGKIYIYEGNSFSVENKYNGIIPYFTQPLWDSSYSQATQINYLRSYSNAIANNYLLNDTYWQGKRLSAIARALVIADRIGANSLKSFFSNRLRSALVEWYEYTPPEGINYFAYFNNNAGATNNWGTMIGYESSYETYNLNDHHFHYGYFIYASAILSMYDSQFKNDYGGMVENLIRDINSPDRNDSMYPFLRFFDPYEGHCWADGFGDTWDGNNQESSSESMNAWIGIYLWGLVTGNNTWRDLGIWGYTVESTAILQYYFNVDGDNWHPSWTKKSVGILFGGKYSHATWFSAEPECIFGIQWIPLTPSHMYLGYNQTLAQNLYNAMTTENGGNENESTWYDVIWKFQSLFNPSAAITKFNALNKGSPNNDPNMQDGSWADCYWFLHNMASLGKPVTNVWAYNWPSYQVFNKNGTNAYVAYNPTGSTKAVYFMNSSGCIGVLTVPPYSTVTSRTLNSCVETLDHFEIVHDGFATVNLFEKVVIKAINNWNTVMTNWTGTVTLYIAPGSTGTIKWTNNNTGNNGVFVPLGAGKARYTFVSADKGVVTLRIIDNTAESIDPECKDNAGHFDNDIPPQFLKFISPPGTGYFINDGMDGTEVWCTAAGNDANDGLSPSTPKRTLTNLIRVYTLKSNDIVYIDVGTHKYKPVFKSSDQGSTGKYLTIMGAGVAGGTTIFDGEFINNQSRGWCFDISNASWIKVTGITFQRAYYGGIHLANGASFNRIEKNTFISNLRGLDINNANNNWIISNEIKRCTTSAGWDVAGIDIDNNSDNNKIIGNIIFDNRYTSADGFGIRFLNGSDYNLISRNTVYSNKKGIVGYPTSPNGNIVAHNFVYKNFGMGIFLNDADNTTVIGNTIYTNSGGPGTGWGIYIAGTSANPVIENNITYGHSANGPANSGIGIDTGYNITVSYNNCYDDSSYENGSVGTVNLDNTCSKGNPLFKNPVNDMHLKYNSPAQNGKVGNGTRCAMGIHTGRVRIDKNWIVNNTTYTLSFMTSYTTSGIPKNGIIEAVFPSGINISGVYSVSSTSLDGTFAYNIISQTLTITRQNNGTSYPGGRIENVIVYGINNVTTSSTYNVLINIKSNNGKIIEKLISNDFRIYLNPPLQILYTYPTNYANNIPLTSKITATFNNSIKTNTVNNNSFKIYDSDWNLVAGSYNTIYNKIIFTPSTNLKPNEFYTVVISKNLKDIYNQNLDSIYTWYFRTGVGSQTVHTYHTITLDGNLSDWNTNNNVTYNNSLSERVANDSSDSAAGETKQLWVTWDSNYLYIAIAKAVASGNDWYDYIAIDVTRDNKGASGNPTGLQARTYYNYRKPEYLLYFDHDNGAPPNADWDTFTLYKFTNNAWNSGTAIPAADRNDNNTQYLEVRIAWSTFGGVPNRISFSAYINGLTDFCPENSSGSNNWVTVDPDNNGDEIPDKGVPPPTQKIIYVDKSQKTGPWDGKSWATAYTQISGPAMNDLANYKSNAIILVAAGTYKETINIYRTNRGRPGATNYIRGYTNGVIIDGEGTRNCIVFAPDGQRVSYFVIENIRCTRGNSEAIRVLYCSNVVLRRVIVDRTLGANRWAIFVSGNS